MAAGKPVSTFLISDVGKLRKNNEDAIGEIPELGVLVLADGMGGHNAGEVASRIAVNTVTETIRKRWGEIDHQGVDERTGHTHEALLLREAIEAANDAIQQVSRTQPQCAGMGTTVVVALLRADLLSVAYVGDSRLYRLRNGTLEQITRDHSLLEELEEASTMVKKNIVTRALGVEETVTADIIEQPLEYRDLILLCSDGLTDLVSDATIAETLLKFENNLAKAGKALVKEANDAGGKDNISIVLARVDAKLTPGQPWYERLLEWL